MNGSPESLSIRNRINTLPLHSYLLLSRFSIVAQVILSDLPNGRP